MNFSGTYQREKRHLNQMYNPMQNSVASYWTEAFQKQEMKYDYSEDLFLNNIHLIPDPLKKNLADSVFHTEVPKKPEKFHQQDQKMPLNEQKVPFENMAEKPKQTTFGGIGSFFTGVMNVLTSVVFRSRSPVNYYDCFDVDSNQGTYSWTHANTDVQDKNGKADGRKNCDVPSNPNVIPDMNFDSRAAVTSCESKLNQVLHLLSPKQTSSPVWVRKRPKKVFVAPGSVEESFEDAFSPEDFNCLSSDPHIEYCSPLQHHCELLCETATQKTKLNTAPVQETTDIVKDVTNKSDLEVKKELIHLKNVNSLLEISGTQLTKVSEQADHQKMQLEKSDLNFEQQEETYSKKSPQVNEETELESPDLKEQLVSSCEDKLLKLKALLQEKRMKCKAKHDVAESRATPPKMIPTEKKSADKHFKNPNRRCSKRIKSKLKCRIEDDLVFANEISVGTPSSVENSPSQRNVSFGDYFDEVSGRFRTLSTGSDDSFQIVFNECVNSGRSRKSSDCDSEDSFIVFEGSPESCYVSNDVFDSDSESEMSDSGRGVTCKLAHTLTRTVSNLADDSLYVESEDEVDFGNVEKCDVNETGLELDCTAKPLEEKSGLLLDEKKKLMRKSLPSKKVQFSTAPPKVHVMRVWAFAARQARAGHWERYAVDRERFKRRIADADMALSWVLKPQHRSRVMFQRFMPWWNQLKRKELAEKKEREEAKKEEEDRQKEEARQQEETKRLNEEKAAEETILNVKDEIEKTTGKETLNTNKDSDERNDDSPENKIGGDDNQIKSKTEDKCDGGKEMCSQNNVDSDITAENTNKKLEFNNNRAINEVGSDKIKSDLIISNEDTQLVTKLQELESNDKNNIEIISS